MSEIDKISLHVRMFNDKVRIMNQTQSKQLILSAQEARNLHADIFTILAQITELATTTVAEPVGTQVGMDGGKF